MDVEENKDGEAIGKFDREKIDKLKEQAHYKVKWQKEIMSNDAVQAFFLDYNSGSISYFIDNYVTNKVFWKEYGANVRNNKERAEERWINEAFEHLGYIQQKKLFDAQCLWRADQVKLPGVEITWDFKVWENNILACPFIEPVTEADVELYANYLAQQNNDDRDYKYGWQDYNEIIQEFKNGETLDLIPAWYQFHNNHTDKGLLMQLPDIRGEKEEFYIETWRNNTLRHQASPAPSANFDNRPFLSFHDENIVNWFVKTFENKEVQRWYNDYNCVQNYDDVYEQVNENIRFLLNTGEKLAIEANDNWVDGLQKLVNDYEAKQLNIAIWEAFEQYQITIQSGLGFSVNENYLKETRNRFAQHILAGRSFNGEPENFDF